jgi:THO complex subunit 7
LLIEGDSGNEDRLINKLIKNFVKWSSMALTGDVSSSETTTTTNDPDFNTIEYLHEQCFASLSHAELGLFKNQFTLDMNKMEQEQYKQLYQRINSEIERAQAKIVQSKVDLLDARKIRKNRQEYDIIAKQILTFPSGRAEMATIIQSLEERVEQLKRSETEYDRKIDLRRKQFSVVLQSLSSLKMLIETDSKIDMDYSHDERDHVVVVSSSSSSSSKSRQDNNEDCDEETPTNEKHAKKSSSSANHSDQKMEES